MLEFLNFVVTPLKVVVGDGWIEVVNVVQSDIPAEPLGNFR